MQNVVKEPQIRDGNDLFEYLRKPIFRSGVFRRLWRPVGRAKKKFSQDVRYLVACLEDVNRIEAVRLLVDESMKRAFSLGDLRCRMAEWRKEVEQRTTGDQGSLLAYSFV